MANNITKDDWQPSAYVLEKIKESDYAALEYAESVERLAVAKNELNRVESEYALTIASANEAIVSARGEINKARRAHAALVDEIASLLYSERDDLAEQIAGLYTAD